MTDFILQDVFGVTYKHFIILLYITQTLRSNDISMQVNLFLYNFHQFTAYVAILSTKCQLSFGTKTAHDKVISEVYQSHPNS